MKNSSEVNKKLTLTVGITTCYGDDSILDTVKSIRASKGVGKFRFIIVSDRTPIKTHIKKELKRYKVELIENKKEGSQTVKQKQILKKCNTDIIILTQDDVLFEVKTIAEILKTFQRYPQVTLISTRKQPVLATNLFEDIITVGTNVANRVARKWNRGDNYMSCIGRCMAFRTKVLKKKFSLPDNIVSTDAFMYFQNKKIGGKYKYLYKTGFFYKKPQTLKEHLRKSRRFQYSRLEMSKYFGDLSAYYKVPKTTILSAILEELASNPIKTLLYFLVYIVTRILKSNPESVLSTDWEIDFSTKKVILK